MATTLIGLIRSDIRRLVDKKQKARRRLERRLAALESKLTVLTAAMRKLGHVPAPTTRGMGLATPGPGGAEIRALRAHLGLSREAFGKRIGVSRTMVYRWESGRAAPRRRSSVDKLEALADKTNEPRLTRPISGRRRRGSRKVRKVA